MPTKPDPRCPFCKDSMEEGFVLEVTRNRRTATEWVKGEPEKGFLGDLKIEKEKKIVLDYLEATFPPRAPASGRGWQNPFSPR